MQTTDLFLKREVIVSAYEQREKVKEQLNTQIAAYLKSGGQIQECTPCTYSDSQIITLSPRQKQRIEILEDIKVCRKRHSRISSRKRSTNVR